MYDREREIRIKIAINQEESEALAKLVAANGICASAVICQLIRQNAAKLATK
jgi:hypothetical protein